VNFSPLRGELKGGEGLSEEALYMCRIAIVFCRYDIEYSADQVINIDVIQFFKLIIFFE
jgi:hypothetical protein